MLWYGKLLCEVEDGVSRDGVGRIEEWTWEDKATEPREKDQGLGVGVIVSRKGQGSRSRSVEVKCSVSRDGVGTIGGGLVRRKWLSWKSNNGGVWIGVGVGVGEGGTQEVGEGKS